MNDGLEMRTITPSDEIEAVSHADVLGLHDIVDRGYRHACRKFGWRHGETFRDEINSSARAGEAERDMI